MVSLCINFITLQSDGKAFADDRDYVAFIQTATLSFCETHEHVNEILTQDSFSSIDACFVWIYCINADADKAGLID